MVYSTSDRRQFNILIEKLKKKLKNFSVINLQKQQIGIIKDVVVDNHQQLQLIVSSETSHIDSRFPESILQLNSKQIKKIEIADKIVVVDFTIANKKQTENVNSSFDSEPVASRNNPRVSDRQKIAASASLGTKSKISAPIMTEAQNQNEIQLNSLQELPPEEIIKLLSERVVVDRKKRKIGEVIVRKEVETRMVEVPVRYEKLIVEQINPERKQIAEIDLGQETLAEPKHNSSEVTNGKTQNAGEFTVQGRFDSPKIASLLLNAIARERQHGCQQIRLEIVVDSPEKQKTYQEWCDRCSQQTEVKHS